MVAADYGVGILLGAKPTWSGPPLSLESLAVYLIALGLFLVIRAAIVRPTTETQ
jgi:hypothetical protein